MSEIKGGMLALIINGPFGENLGRAVTVDYFIGEHTSKTGVTMQDCWSIVPARDRLWVLIVRQARSAVMREASFLQSG